MSDELKRISGEAVVAQSNSYRGVCLVWTEVIPRKASVKISEIRTMNLTNTGPDQLVLLSVVLLKIPSDEYSCQMHTVYFYNSVMTTSSAMTIRLYVLPRSSSMIHFKVTNCFLTLILISV
jgi:hypothetical protein